MGTIQTTLRVVADAGAAARGLKPLDTALQDVKNTSQDAERALKDLGGQHRVRVDDSQVDRAQREITRLRREMRDRLEVDVNADTRDIQRKITGLRRTIRELERDDIDLKVDVDTSDLDRVNRGIGRGLGNARSGLKKVGGIAAGIGAVVGIATLGVGTVIGKIGIEVLSLADQMAQARIAFTQFLGTAPKADRFLDRLEDFAKKTPFEFPELVESSKQLLAFGVDAGDVIGIMTSLGDAAALTGQNVTDLTTIWGQMEAKGRVANEELLQLTERGIPAYQMLADAMGLSVPEIQKMASEGRLLSTDVLPVLQQQMNNTFGGGMAKQAQTLGGLWSTMQDTIAGVGREIGEAFTPIVAEQLGNFTEKLDELGTWVSENKSVLVEAFAGIVEEALNFAGSILQAFSSIIIAIADVLEAFDGMRGISEWTVGDPFGDADLKGSAKDLRAVGEEVGTGATDLYKWGEEALASGEKFGRAFEKSDAIQARKNDLADLNAEIGALRKRPPTVGVRGEIWRKTKEAKELREEIQDLEDVEAVANIDLDIKDAKARRAEIDQVLRELGQEEATPKVKADIEHWTAERAKVDAEIAVLTKRRNKINLDPEVDPAKKNSSTAALEGVVSNSGKGWKAPVKPEVTGVEDAKGTLNDAAKPGGKARTAPLWLDVLNVEATEQQLAALTRVRTAVVNVTTGIVDRFFGGGGGTPRQMSPQTVGPTPEERSMLRTSGASLVASTPRAMGSTVAMAPGVSVAAGAITRQPSPAARVEPRRTPVAVYLDGQDIADRLATRVSARATSTSMSRRA
jgi:tape measure domain-containing protein